MPEKVIDGTGLQKVVNLEAAVLTQEDDGRSSLGGARGAVTDGHHVNDLGLGSNFYLLLE